MVTIGLAVNMNAEIITAMTCVHNNQLLDIDENVVAIIPTENIGYVDLSLKLSQDLHVKVNVADIQDNVFIDGIIDRRFTEGEHLENLNLSQLQSGLYNINIMYSDKVFQQKLIVMNE